MGQYDHIQDADERAWLELRDTLLKDPATRRLVQKKAKEAHPDAIIPELDLADQQEKFQNEITERLAKEAQDRKDREAADIITKNRQMLKDQGLQDTEISQIEELMTKGEYPNNYEKAFKIYQKEQDISRSKDRPYDEESVLTMPDKEQFKGLYDNPSAFATREAHKAITEMQRARGN